MSFEIALVLLILVVAMVLFVTEILRMDVVALLVLSTLALTGLVTPEQALSGFSNPAVVTVWAMFILSGGLTVTGVANVMGKQVLKLAGTTEPRIVGVIMLTSGILSSVMNNIGVAALLLPVVMDIAKRTRIPPSKLLMPLAYGTLLGGLTTLIGTPPNLLASEALVLAGLEPYGLFDFTPTGVAALLVGTLFCVGVSRYLLPRIESRSTPLSSGQDQSLAEQYDLRESMFVLRVKPASVLAGRDLAFARFGSAAGLTVVAILRGSQTILAPRPDQPLRGNDRLLVSGREGQFRLLRGWQDQVVEGDQASRSVDVMHTVSNRIGMGELRVARRSDLIGQTLIQCDFRARFGVNVLAFRRGRKVIRQNLGEVIMERGDYLLVQGNREQLQVLDDSGEFEGFDDVTREFVETYYDLSDWIYVVDVPDGSTLAGLSLAKSRLGDAFGLQVLSIVRGGQATLVPDPHAPIQAGDRLLIKGQREDLRLFAGYRELEIERDVTPYMNVMDAEDHAVEEVVLAPRSGVAGKSPRELHFRERYGLQILAVYRQGEVFRLNLRDMPLQFGDALLLQGSVEHFNSLAADPDFLVLTASDQEVIRPRMAPVAALILVAMLVPVLMGWLPVSVASVAALTTMILTGCLTMEEAYGFIAWRPIFLVAGMLPLGVAMQESGAANLVAELMVDLVGGWGPWAVIIGLYLITTLATTVVPTAALIVLMAPIAIKTSAEMGISGQAAMMTVAMAASASFTSPISHPANVLVMGPAGYKFIDFMRLGIPLTLVVMAAVLVTLHFAWPL